MKVLHFKNTKTKMDQVHKYRIEQLLATCDGSCKGCGRPNPNPGKRWTCKRCHSDVVSQRRCSICLCENHERTSFCNRYSVFRCNEHIGKCDVCGVNPQEIKCYFCACLVCNACASNNRCNVFGLNMFFANMMTSRAMIHAMNCGDHEGLTEAEFMRTFFGSDITQQSSDYVMDCCSLPLAESLDGNLSDSSDDES